MADRSTIRDVARVAGVSVSTVSRVFTSPELFREETRLKVYAAAEQLRYAPSKAATALTTGRTGNIGLVVPNLANPLFPEMVKAAQHQARRHNLAALLGDSDDDADDEEKLIHALSKDVDGLLLFSSLLRDEQIGSAGGLRPTVFVNRRVEGYPCVLVDALQGMRLLTQYLSNLGHTGALYLAGPTNSWAAKDRQNALITAGEETGFQIEVTAPHRPTFESGTLAAEQLVRAPLPSAVVCFNDVMALGLTARLLEFGVQVPEQVSVVGWGGTQLASYTTPAVTTLAVPLSRLGSVAVDQLLLTRNSETEGETVPVSLEVTLSARATTSRARAR
jgi:DNA-binding LacI/PurR family transcriptional regulator